jgi:hypothetical protein
VKRKTPPFRVVEVLVENKLSQNVAVSTTAIATNQPNAFC